MKLISKLENIDFSKDSYKKLNINATIYNAYQNQKQTKNEFIDFTDVIWTEDLDKMVKDLKDYKVEYITVSSTFSGLLDALAGFENLGCKLLGLTKVNRTYDDRLSNAIKIKI